MKKLAHCLHAGQYLDDDLSMRRSMERLLRNHGFTAVVFDSAGALLLEDACCLVLDINLTATRVSHCGAGWQVRALRCPSSTSRATIARQIRPAAIESGCAAYLSKPFAASKLIETVERACGKRA